MSTPTPTARTKTSHPSRHILVIEDNRPDVILTRMVHDEVKFCSTLDAVEDGDQALRYLRNLDEYSDKKRPDIIFLDLSLPRRSGLEVLSELRKVPGCELIPIIVLSGSSNPEEIAEAYARGANCVINKASRLEEFYRLLENCYEFWCTCVTLAQERAA